MTRSANSLLVWLALLLAPVFLLASSDSDVASPPASGFERVWERTDLPIARGLTDRTWIWGPHQISDVIQETADQSDAGILTVQYFDKARMEAPASVGPESVDLIRSGAIVNELLSGELADSDDPTAGQAQMDAFVAGDQDAPDGVSYRTLGMLRGAEAVDEGAVIQTRLLANGRLEDDSELAVHGVTAGELVEGSGHRVASVFWEFLTSVGTVWDGVEAVDDRIFSEPLEATGDPLTEAYWLDAWVNGEPRVVLVQCFERRCLTFTPGNPDGWEVEANNAGRHFFEWRYGDKGVAEPMPTPEAEHPDGLPRITFDAGGGDGPAMWVEVAASPATRQCGLMHRTELPDDTGMLFVFEGMGTGGFWNCNTFIPLTLAWIDSDGVIVGLSDMEAQVQGEPQFPITYPPPAPYRFVVEANQGWFAQRGIEVGDRVNLEHALEAGETVTATLCQELGLDCG